MLGYMPTHRVVEGLRQAMDWYHSPSNSREKCRMSRLGRTPVAARSRQSESATLPSLLIPPIFLPLSTDS